MSGVNNYSAPPPPPPPPHTHTHAHAQGLPFQTVQHAITVNDASVTVDGGLLVMVIGQLKVSSQCVVPCQQIVIGDSWSI